MQLKRNKNKFSKEKEAEILNQLTEILKTTLDIDTEITLNTTFKQLEMDDLDIAEFYMAIENELNVRIISTKYNKLSDVITDILHSLNK